MRIDPRMLIMLNSQTSTDSLGLADASEEAFAQLLDAEVHKYRRVISAEEILADLDGSPSANFRTEWNERGTEYIKADSNQSNQQLPVSRQQILSKIGQIAQKYGVDPDLVREVVRAESNFNPNATSRAGAKGLMQLMDSTARSHHVYNSYDPEQNLAGGTKYLRELLTRYNGNVKVALAAYNAGPGRIDLLNIDTDEEFDQKAQYLPRETQNYVKKIVARLDQDSR